MNDNFSRQQSAGLKYLMLLLLAVSSLSRPVGAIELDRPPPGGSGPVLLKPGAGGVAPQHRKLMAEIIGVGAENSGRALLLRDGSDGVFSLSVPGPAGELASGQMVKLREFPLQQSDALPPELVGEARVIALRQRGILGQVVGTLGSKYVYGISYQVTLDLGGQEHRQTAFFALETADSPHMLKTYAEEHTARLSSAYAMGSTPDGTPSGWRDMAQGAGGIGPGTSSGQVSCSSCGWNYNSQLNYCDVLFQACSTGAVVAALGAYAGCMSVTRVHAVCIGVADLTFASVMAQCFGGLSTCFTNAHNGYTSCVRSCYPGDGPPINP